MGKLYENHSRPQAQYFDPDTCLVLEEIPKCLTNMEEFESSEHFEFLKSCYTDDDNFLKAELTEKEKEKLIAIFHDHSYKVFMEKAEENLNLK